MIAKFVVLPVRAATKLVRVIRLRRVVLLGVGAILGAIGTPWSGAELRAKIRTELRKRRSGSEAGIEDRVRQRLASAPRTWHLAQPEVVAVAGETESGWRIILAGTVPDEVARQDLTETARAVVGVADVDNRMRVETNEER